MCGRYYIDDDTYAEMQKALHELDIKHSVSKGEIFPTNIAPVITQGGVSAIKWGFPQWKGTGVLINARAETAMEKSMFKKPLRERRCVVPSNGFYEWDSMNGKKKKDKYFLRHPGTNALYMAGMVNTFMNADGGLYDAFVILTTAANASVSRIHGRMPVILADDERERWINDVESTQFFLSRQGAELFLEKV